ncbi:uncharacterized protein LOC121811685 [Salvia splendens]|uniref:uncharacterized protein LOC121811685 n=1 Tax=Salvia splendens TaxID=180675 RepID=UPI001C261531|nr:uncharacterized protein LOC121811685 [Salvia splendens]
MGAFCQAVMNLKLSGSNNISSYMAALSRLKPKALPILCNFVKLKVSYLDEVASNTTIQDIAKSVGLEVLALLKKAWYRFKTAKCSLREKRLRSDIDDAVDDVIPVDENYGLE